MYFLYMIFVVIVLMQLLKKFNRFVVCSSDTTIEVLMALDVHYGSNGHLLLIEVHFL